MKRLLIFLVLFPPLALVVFNGPDMIARHDFRLLDFTSLQMAYALAVIPALLLAAVDWKLSTKPNLVRVLGTTATGALAADSIALFMWGGANDLWPVLMAGLVGGLPAAACSSLLCEKEREAAE